MTSHLDPVTRAQLLIQIKTYFADFLGFDTLVAGHVEKLISQSTEQGFDPDFLIYLVENCLGRNYRKQYPKDQIATMKTVLYTTVLILCYRLPAYQSLFYTSWEQLTMDYPSFLTELSPSNKADLKEMQALLKYRNYLKLFLQLFHGEDHKLLSLAVVGRLDGANQEYKTGKGQTKATSRRCEMYHRESQIPRKEIPALQKKRKSLKQQQQADIPSSSSSSAPPQIVQRSSSGGAPSSPSETAASPTTSPTIHKHRRTTPIQIDVHATPLLQHVALSCTSSCSSISSYSNPFGYPPYPFHRNGSTDGIPPSLEQFFANFSEMDDIPEEAEEVDEVIDSCLDDLMLDEELERGRLSLEGLAPPPLSLEKQEVSLIPEAALPSPVVSSSTASHRSPPQEEMVNPFHNEEAAFLIPFSYEGDVSEDLVNLATGKPIHRLQDLMGDLSPIVP